MILVSQSEETPKCETFGLQVGFCSGKKYSSKEEATATVQKPQLMAPNGGSIDIPNITLPFYDWKPMSINIPNADEIYKRMGCSLLESFCIMKKIVINDHFSYDYII